MTKSFCRIVCISLAEELVGGLGEAAFRLEMKRHLGSKIHCLVYSLFLPSNFKKCIVSPNIILFYLILCPPGSWRRQFTIPTTPEVPQLFAVNHTECSEGSASICWKRNILFNCHGIVISILRNMKIATLKFQRICILKVEILLTDGCKL